MNRDIFELTLTLLQAKGVFDKDKGVSAYKKILIEEFPFFEKALELAIKQEKFIQKLKSNLISGYFEDKLEHTNKDGSSKNNVYNKGLYDMVNAIEEYILQEFKELENE